MNSNIQVLRKWFLSGLVALAISGCGLKPPHITSAVLSPGSTKELPATEFPTNTPRIVCTWQADGFGANTTIRDVWIAEDVGSVAPQNYKIHDAIRSSPYAVAGTLSLPMPSSGFPVGKYRLEIYVGKELSKTVRFTVFAMAA